MKKIIFLCLLTLICLFSPDTSSSASGSMLPKGRNYLSLSNLKVHPNAYMAETIHHIRLEKNQTYTLVIDFETLGRHLYNLGDLWMEVEFFPGPYSGDFYFIADMSHERVFVEFSAFDIDFRITALPIDDASDSYNIILFKGTYLQFPGFEPYLHHTDSLISEGVLPMDYDARLTVSEIASLIVAKDPMGNVLPKTLEADAYSGSSQLPGSYQMIFSTQYNAIKKRYLLDIRIYDLTPPVILAPALIEVPLHQKSSVGSIMHAFEVTDNVDDMDMEDVVILEDTYTPATSIGTYHIRMKATDYAGNSTELSVPITLIDRLGPSITGPSSIYIYTTDVPLSTASILSRFSAHDNVDGNNIQLNIVQNQYHQTTTPGIYVMEIAASDAAGNTTSFFLNVHVVDNRSPIFVVDTQILSLSEAASMTEEEIILWFRNQLLSQGFTATHVEILYNEYALGSKKSGEYYVYLSYQLNGEPAMSRILMDVSESSRSGLPMHVIIPSALGLIAILGVMILKFKKK